MPVIARDAWRVLPALIVRPAGFAFDRLVALRFPRARAAAHARLAADAARGELGHALDRAISQERYGEVAELDEPAARKQFSRHIKRARAFARREGGAPRELPDDALREVARIIPSVAPMIAALRDRHAGWLAAEQAYDAAFADELATQRAALRATYADDVRLREAVFLESSEASERVAQLLANPGPRDARARQRERLAAMYLQRFCAKNDTHSICGPHAVAFVDDDHQGPARLTVHASDERRAVYFSHWAAERIWQDACRRAGEDDHLAVRVHPTVSRQDDAIAWCAIDHDATVAFRRSYRRAALPAEARPVLDLLAHTPLPMRALRDRAADFGLEPDELGELIDSLVDAGVLVRRATIAPGVFHPLDDVAAQLARWPASAPRDQAQAEVRELQQRVAAFTAAELAERQVQYRQLVERYREITGDAAERGAGRHYADRAIIHEDCHAAIDATLGRATLAPLLDALIPLVHAAALPIELIREGVRAWFRARYGEGTRVRVLDVHRAFDEARAAEHAADTPRAAALRDAITRVRACFELALAQADDGCARVPAAALRDALAGVATPEPGYVSVDVMLCGAPDAPAPSLVLGEVHGFFWLPTCLLDVVPEPARGQAIAQMREAMRALAGGRPTVECQFAHTQATDRRVALTDGDLLLVDPSEPGGLGLGQLEMALDGDTLRFYDVRNPDIAREVVPVSVYTTYPFLGYTSPIAPLVDDFAGKFFPETLLPDAARAPDAPRLVVDELTFRRRAWTRPAAALHAALADAPGHAGTAGDAARKDAALFARGQALRAQLGCPATVFASLPGEPKPVLVDFDNFFLVETFAHLLARVAGEQADACVRITEMLPGPDELFARGPDGARTSELRMGFYRLPA